MDTRFKLTADGTIHIDNDRHSYSDTLENALADITSAGLTLTAPDLASVSGAIAVVGFEVSEDKKEFILENGWHYPMTTAQATDYNQYVACISKALNIQTEKDKRLGKGQQGV